MPLLHKPMSRATQTTLSNSQRISLQSFMGSLRISPFDLSKPSTEVRAAIPTDLINDDPIEWIERHFYIPETRGPIVLSEHQKTALRHALTRDDNGLFRYSVIVYSDIKKSAKSTIAAAVTLWRAFQVDATDGWGSIYIIANDLKQADSRVAYYMRRAIQLNPRIRELCTVRTGSYKVTLPNQTFIEAIPIDPSGEAGSNADMVVFSELWGAHSKAQAQMWTEATLPPNKFGKSFRWIETYAGVAGEAPILERLYEQAVKLGRRLDDDLELFDDPGARLFCMWNTRPRLPWQTEEYYASERAALMPEEFARVHRNEWATGGANSFLPSIALWDACRADVPPLDGHTPCVLALDAAESNDTFGTVIVSKLGEQLAVRYVRPYVPSKGAPLDFDAIEQDIRDLVQRYAVQAIVYDPMLLGQTVRRLTAPGNAINTPCVPFPQGAARLESDKGLFDLITQRRIVHDGNAELRAHVANANKKTDAESRKLRIVKRTYQEKIDLVVALAMSCQYLVKLDGQTIYLSGDI